MDASDRSQRSIVRGIVSYPDKSAAVGLTVIAFDKDVVGEDRLGQEITDKEGGYKVAYSEARFRRSPNESRGADVS